jgi:3-phenylpropionate/trans-cinnamate dioxygenase ferredoxin subunit
MSQPPAIALIDLPPGTAKPLCIAGQAVLLVNHEGTIHAVANECSHAFQTLEGGRVMNGWIACPAHGARFDLATGEALNPPATAPIATFPVRIEGGLVYIEV